MKFIEITYSKIKTEIENYLKKEYSKADILYSVASPYGQILTVIENLFQLAFLYLKNSIRQFDIGDPAANNERMIKNAAILGGHNPSRHTSATGTLKMSLKVSANVETDISGSRITLTDKQTIRNKTNGLDYSLSLGKDSNTYNITSSTDIYYNIIQGKWETKIFTGSGEENQTFQITLRGNQEIENNNVEVFVGGEMWSIRKSLYDISMDEKACVVKSGFNGGIDVIFGNGAFGAIPAISNPIEIRYLISDGSAGNIFRRTPNDWLFVDPAIGGNGDTIDIAKLFDVFIYTDINLGADKEKVAFTKNLLPIVSNNYVLGTAQQYAYTLKQLGVFSHVNAYEDYGVIYIVATPNIKLFRNQNADYFSVNKNAFILDNYEKYKIDNYLKSGGRIQLTKKYQISSPDLSYYIINIFVRRYSDSIEENVNAQILDVISTYFLNLTRIDRIPKVDLIKVLASITDLHSVDISFISKKNEDYHKAAMLEDQNRRNQYASLTDINLDRELPDYDSSTVLGIDPILGDIVFEPNEYPIIRGGWYNRDGVYVSDDVYGTGFKAVNIIHKGTIDAKNRNPL